MNNDSFWNKTKKSIESWAPKTSPNSPQLITPIFAHVSEDPVLIKDDPIFHFDDPENLNEYHYLVTLIKKKGRYKGSLRVYLLQGGEEVPISMDEKFFGLNDLKQIGEFMGIPNGIFYLKNKNKKVITFKGTRMTELEFDRKIEKWSKKQI